MGPGDPSTNEHSGSGIPGEKTGPLSRHSDICFDDGNLAVLTGNVYFLVHQGLLCRRSKVFEKLAKGLSDRHIFTLERRSVLHLQDSPEDMAQFLLALYDGIPNLTCDANNFALVAGLLRLSTKYQVSGLRENILHVLSLSWPSTLSQWELRESATTHSSGSYDPRQLFPHPILVINLAREIDAPHLLPSAFYDLSRSSPSDCTAGYVDNDGLVHQLSREDLLELFKGREVASHFLLRFIFDELEGRGPSASCLLKDTTRWRTCEVAFQAIAFELLCDANGLSRQRHFDPLYAILDADLMDIRDNESEVDSRIEYRACEECRSEFGTVVTAAREQFWQRLPLWFGIELLNWG